MSDWGMKVSKPGKDVKTCGPEDLVFNSEWDVLVQYLDKSGHTSSSSYNHALGYFPSFFVWGLSTYYGDYILQNGHDVRTTINNLYFSGGDITAVHYLVFVEKSNE